MCIIYIKILYNIYIDAIQYISKKIYYASRVKLHQIRGFKAAEKPFTLY